MQKTQHLENKLLTYEIDNSLKIDPDARDRKRDIQIPVVFPTVQAAFMPEKEFSTMAFCNRIDSKQIDLVLFDL